MNDNLKQGDLKPDDTELKGENEVPEQLIQREAMWNVIVDNNLIGGSVISDTRAVVEEMKLEIENFGKAGIFIIKCLESKKMFIMDDQTDTFGLFKLMVKNLFYQTNEPTFFVFKEDVERYEASDFEFYINTGAYLQDPDVRKRVVEQMKKINLGYTIYGRKIKNK